MLCIQNIYSVYRISLSVHCGHDSSRTAVGTGRLVTRIERVENISVDIQRFMCFFVKDAGFI
jgi:hypothetical protein